MLGGGGVRVVFDGEKVNGKDDGNEEKNQGAYGGKDDGVTARFGCIGSIRGLFLRQEAGLRLETGQGNGRTVEWVIRKGAWVIKIASGVVFASGAWGTSRRQ
jgi:hypothetical protein